MDAGQHLPNSLRQLPPASRLVGDPTAPDREALLNSYLSHLGTKIRKKLRMEPSLSEIDPYLAAKTLHFQAPQITPELLGAIKLISPQFHLQCTERSRKFWELNQNGLCWGEYEALAPFLSHLGAPAKVLDIGPGMGRSTVFFKSIMDWQDTPFHLYESTGETTKYTKAGPRFDDSFCGSLDLLGTVLAHNQTRAFEIFDASDLDAKLSRLPGPYDFIYSFFAVGWHWSIEHFLDEILSLMTDTSIGAFTLHPRYRGSAELDRLPHRMVTFRRSWPRERWSNMVVLAKTEDALPKVG